MLYMYCTVALQSLPQFGDSSRISLKSGCSCFPSIPATIQTVRTPATRPGAVAVAPSGYGDRSTASSFARAPRPIAGRRQRSFTSSLQKDWCPQAVRARSRPRLAPLPQSDRGIPSRRTQIKPDRSRPESQWKLPVEAYLTDAGSRVSRRPPITQRIRRKLSILLWQSLSMPIGSSKPLSGFTPI